MATLPPGFTLDEPTAGQESLPDGYTLDAPSDSGLPEGYTLDEAPEPTALETAGDIALGVGRGAVGAVRSITDVAGADNPISQYLRGVEESATEYMSPESEERSRKVNAILKEAEGKGIIAESKAALKAFGADPAMMTAQGAGSLLPMLATGTIGKVLKYGKRGISALMGTVGAAQGAGIVKGSIYDETKATLLEQGASEDVAEATAVEAQSYGGQNLDQILVGAGLGVLASRTGAEGILTRSLARSGRKAGAGIVRNVVRGAATEAVPEAVQGGQERFASNLALHRQGHDVDLWDGVVGQGVLEGTVGAILGGALGPLDLEGVDSMSDEDQRVVVASGIRSMLENDYNETDTAFLDKVEQALANTDDPALIDRINAEVAKHLEARGITDHQFRPTQPDATQTQQDSSADQSDASNEATGSASAANRDAVRQSFNQRVAPFMDNAEVVDSTDALPDDVRRRVQNSLGEDRQPEGFYDPETGKVFIVADGITPERVPVVALQHEALHRGFDGMFGAKQSQQILDQVYAKLTTDQVNRLRTDYGDNKSVIAEEALAKIAENPDSDPTTWNRVVATVRQVLRNAGLVSDMSDNDIRVLIYNAVSKGRGRSARVGRDGSVKFSMAEQDSGVRFSIGRAVDRAKEKYADFSSNSEEEFFNNFWPKILKETGLTRKPTMQNLRRAAKQAIRDMEAWLAANPKFKDYYNEDMKALREVLDDRFGQLTNDQFIYFQLALGLTSPNTQLPSNVGDALTAMDLYIEDGNLDRVVMGESDIESAPITLSGTTAPAKGRALKVIDRLVAERGGVYQALRYLQEPIPVKELHAFKKEMGYKGGVGSIGAIKSLVKQATGQDILIPRMFIFGKKVGAYTLNTTGDHRYNTIDIWESRFIRSYFDGMFEANTGLPVNNFEHDLFQRFTEIFQEEYESVTGQEHETSALQAQRWYFILAMAREAGYTNASTSKTLSEYAAEKSDASRTRRPYRRETSDGATTERDQGQADQVKFSLANPDVYAKGLIEKMDNGEIEESTEVPFSISRPILPSSIEIHRAKGEGFKDFILNILKSSDPLVEKNESLSTNSTYYKSPNWKHEIRFSDHAKYGSNQPSHIRNWTKYNLSEKIDRAIRSAYTGVKQFSKLPSWEEIEAQSGKSLASRGASQIRAKSIPEKGHDNTKPQPSPDVKFSISDTPEQDNLDAILDEIRSEQSRRGQRMRNTIRNEATSADPRVDRNRLIQSDQSYYDQVSINEASERIESMTPEDVRNLAGSISSGNHNYMTALAAIRVINEDAAAGRDVEPMLESLAEAGTGAGQFIRMFAELKQKTVPGLLAAIEQRMAKKKKYLTDKQRSDLSRLIKLDFEARDAFNTAAEQAKADPLNSNEKELNDLRDRAEQASLKMMRYAARMMPKSMSSIITQLIQGNLLVPISHVRNITSNVMMQAIRDTEQSMAAMGDMVISAITGRNRTVMMPSITGRIAGASKGIKQGVKELFTGARPDANVHGEYNIRGFQPLHAWANIFNPSRIPVNENGKRSVSDFVKNFVEGTFGIPAEINFRLLGLGDHPFRESAYQSVIREQARIRGLKGRAKKEFLKRPDGPANEVALRESLESVYQNKNLAASHLRAFQGLPRKIPIVGNWIEALALKPIFPYVQTPMNLAHVALQLASPGYSAARTAYFTLMASRESDPKVKAAFTRKSRMAAARTVVGATFNAAAAALVQAGLIRGDEEDKERTLAYQIGFPPNSINISGLGRLMNGEDPSWQEGDRVHSLFLYGFFGVNAMIEANAMGRSDDAGIDDVSQFKRMMGSRAAELASVMVEMTVLKGASDVLSAISSGQYDRWYRNYAGVVTSAALPNTIAAYNRVKQDALPDLKGHPKGIADAFKIAAQERNPFVNMNDLYPYRRDPLGQQIDRTPEGAQPWMYHMFDASKSQTVTSDPVWQEIGRLYERTQDTDVIPSMPGRVAKGSKVKPWEYDYMMELVGEERKARVLAVMNDARYATAPDSAKVKALKQAYDKGASVGRERYIRARAARNYFRPDSPIEDYIKERRVSQRR